MKTSFITAVFFVALLLLILCVAPLSAQQGGAVAGNVTDPDGAAIAHALVTLQKPSGISDRQIATDAQGPGNIRDLEDVIGNACMMAEGNLTDIGDLPERLRGPLAAEAFTNDKFLSLDDVQRRHVMNVLEGVGGNKARAAEILGIGRATIYQFLSKMKIEERTDESA